MGNVFRGWRRKVGCVTLLMACVFMGGWIRSFHRHDVVTIPTGRNTEENLVSQGHYLLWINSHHVNSEDVAESVRWMTYDSFNSLFSDPGVKWLWQWGGFGMGELGYNKFSREPFFIMPFWSIVIPLTLLSAFLLRSKPHKSTKKKITEPVPADGA